MEKWKYIFDKDKRTILLRAFHIWQLRPNKVAALSDTYHECASCGTSFQGNYCPRCGQSAAVGRFSFKNALLLFIDVWGVGNRSMFRSIRDLMFRPGYMIRDYLRGMQSAYFPPFKMFFLLTALSILVEHGLNLTPTDTKEPTPPSRWTAQVEDEEDVNEYEQFTTNDNPLESPMYQKGVKFANFLDSIREKNPAIFALIIQVLFTTPLYFLLRSSPNIPDLRYSEFIVALVYTSNTYSIYSIAGKLLNSSILNLIAILMVFVALKQFSGYSKRHVFWNIALSVFISFVVFASVVGLYTFIAYLNTGQPVGNSAS